MRVLTITAGAAGMYCGTCIRDNALAAELGRQGHEVMLLPIYTPTRPDEPNVSHDRLFFNGISVFLRQRFPVPAALEKLLESRWLLKLATARAMPVDPKVLGELTVAMLKGEDGILRREFTKMVDWLRTQAAPDVIELSHTLLAGLIKQLKEALGRPICCTLQGENLFLDGLAEPYRSESLALIRASVRHVDAFIAGSEFYAGFMSRYLSIPREKIKVVPLGINLDGHARIPRSDGVFRIGYMARIAPEKGLHVLAAAYALLRRVQNGPVRLEAAGYLPADHKRYLRDIGRKLGSEFQYHGEVNRPGKIRFLQSLDVLSVPSTVDEPKGLFVFEAMANGVPVVQPRRGAYPEVIERTQGGLLVPPDDPEALADGLRALWRDPVLRERLGEQGFTGVREHHSIARMAERTLAVYRSVIRAAHA
jgi:glycosyltransferase involved in cell wall biosynthesis